MPIGENSFIFLFFVGKEKFYGAFKSEKSAAIGAGGGLTCGRIYDIIKKSNFSRREQKGREQK